MRKCSPLLARFAGALGLPGQNFRSVYMKLAASACRGNMGPRDNVVPMTREFFCYDERACAVILPRQTGLECLYVIKLPRQTGIPLANCRGPGLPGQDFLI